MGVMVVAPEILMTTGMFLGEKLARKTSKSHGCPPFPLVTRAFNPLPPLKIHECHLKKGTISTGDVHLPTSNFQGIFVSFGVPRRKFNIDTKNGHIWSRSPPFPRPISLRISIRSFSGVSFPSILVGGSPPVGHPKKVVNSKGIRSPKWPNHSG